MMKTIRDYINLIEGIEVPNVLYHITHTENVPSIKQHGIQPRAGTWMKTKWAPRVFFATTLNGAYEIVMMFMHEKQRGEYAIIEVNPYKIPKASFRRDREYEFGVWINVSVPLNAIIGIQEADGDYLESDDFRAFMGLDDEEDD